MAVETVRPFKTASEYERMIDYFLDSDDAALLRMGVARELLPRRADWLANVLADHERPDHQKERLYIGWFMDGEQVGHSSVNRIRVGVDAYFHLHLWRSDLRQAGAGTRFCEQSMSIYFERLRLACLWCEPHAENAAPNRTLRRLGFEFVRRHRTIPGPINFEQYVNLYRRLRTGSGPA